VKKLIGHYGLKRTLQEFVAFDRWYDVTFEAPPGYDFDKDDPALWTASPPNETTPPGRDYPLEDGFLFGASRRLGACLLYKNERCIIHELKPRECRMTFGSGCKTASGGGRSERERIMREWKKPAAMRFMVHLRAAARKWAGGGK